MLTVRLPCSIIPASRSYLLVGNPPEWACHWKRSCHESSHSLSGLIVHTTTNPEQVERFLPCSAELEVGFPDGDALYRHIEQSLRRFRYEPLERRRWLRGLEQGRQLGRLNLQTRMVVGDRESDIYELFQQQSAHAGVGWLPISGRVGMR